MTSRHSQRGRPNALGNEEHGDESPFAAAGLDALVRGDVAACLRKHARYPREASERSDVVVGTATSMQKILPRGAAVPQVQPVRDVAISLAQREGELSGARPAAQQPINDVHLRVSDLRAASGNLLAAANIAAVPVGYVETKSVPPYGSAHVGWWPDPILDFLHSADIAAGDVQAFKDAYVRILESLVAQVESLANRSAQQDAWLPQAKQALAVPEELVKSLTEYTSDPAVVYRWRAQLARAIQDAGIAPGDPG